MIFAGLVLHNAANAGGETRTLRLYSVNTKESLKTTYMVNGRHVPSELAKINHLLRDWRRDAVIKIDTETIDLMWELHADLGSNAPIHIISAYRSAETNALLRKIGRNVAKKSMHIQGKAIDLYFPDVPTERLRNSALVREIGGVGYYPRSGSSGFVHIDSGRVRHWPGIPKTKVAQIYRDYRKTVGARLNGDSGTVVASAEPQAKPTRVAQGYPVPTPRPRPIEVLMMAAAAEPNIEPAAAPVPKRNFAAKSSLVRDRLGRIRATADTVTGPRSNTSAKSSFIAALRKGNVAGLPSIRLIGAPVQARAGVQDGPFEWAKDLLRGAERLIRRDGWPQPFGVDDGAARVAEPREPFPPITEEELAQIDLVLAAIDTEARGWVDSDGLSSVRRAAKGNRLVINRSSKGDLIFTAPRPRYGIRASEAVSAETGDEASDAAPASTAAATFQTLLGAVKPGE